MLSGTVNYSRNPLPTTKRQRYTEHKYPLGRQECPHRIQKSSLNNIFTYDIIKPINCLEGNIFDLIGGLKARLIVNDCYDNDVKQHQEIINQIKIISAINIDDLSQEECEFFYPKDDTQITQWMRFNNIDNLVLTSTPTDVLFKSYLSWCEKSKIKIPLGKKHFFALIENNFALMKKQKADGKRYFAKIK